MGNQWSAILPILLCAAGMGFTANDEEGNYLLQRKRDVEVTMKLAQELVQERALLGARLVGVVADKSQPYNERHRAGELLAKLHYLPAIDVLIQYVDLADPTYVSFETRWDLAFPLVGALAAFGDAAVPKIVDACAREENQERRILLAFAIQYGKTKAVAVRYIRGMELSSEQMKGRLRNLENILVPGGGAAPKK